METFTIIKLEDKYLLLSDEEMKENDTALDLCEDMGAKFESFIVDKATLKYANQECKKIISENPDFSLLSEADCKIIGWVDVEKLAERNSEFQEATYTIQHKVTYKHGFIDGFKKAQSLNDKMFSLENMKLAWELGSDYGDIVLLDALEAQTKFIQSLQQTSWEVEVEMEQTHWKGTKLSYEDKFKPKITNNSIKVTKIL